jgi:DNA modification methylase
LLNAKLLSRNFIGIELDEEYVKVAQKRIKEVAGCKAEGDDGIHPTNKLVSILPKIL